jgi:hypothetical protein
MENKVEGKEVVKKESKIKISPEQIDKATEAMGKAATSVDNLYGNIKGKLGPMGQAIGFAVLATFAIALIAHPGLVWVLILFVAVGAAPMIRAKIREIQASQASKKEDDQKPEQK